MTLLPLDITSSTPDSISKQPSRERLLGGEILLEMRSHSAWGGAVTAQMYLPLKQAQVWQQLTNYPRWVNYFPDLTHSEVLHTENTLHRRYKYLYQAARKSFFTLSAQVEVYLQVEEVDQQTIEFRLEKGSFSDFSAQLHLQAYSDGTLLTYTVAAILPIPVPSVLLQQMMAFGLPANMAQMRKILCHKVKPAKIC